MKALIALLSVIGYVACVIGTGIWSWNWIEPDSFWGALKFLICWSISGSVVCGVWWLICGVLFGFIED